MKNITILSIFLFSLNTAFCQENTTPKNIKLKLYVKGNYQKTQETTVYEHINYTSHVTISNKDFDFGKLSFAVELNQNKKFRHEIGVTDLTFKRENSKTIVKDSNTEINDVTAGEKNTTIGSAVRYQFNYYLLTDKQINPYVGGASKIHALYNEIHPITSLSFPISYTDIYLPLEIVLGVEIKISEQFSLNADVPFTLYQFWYEKEFIDNPQLAKNLKKTSTINGESFPKLYNFRIGVSYKL